MYIHYNLDLLTCKAYGFLNKVLHEIVSLSVNYSVCSFITIVENMHNCERTESKMNLYLCFTH